MSGFLSGKSSLSVVTTADIALKAVTGPKLGGGVIPATTGFSHSIFDLGTNLSGTETLDEANGQMQKGVNNGAHTLSPQSNDSVIRVHYSNGASAGAITTSGFTYVTGDTYDLTENSDYILTSIVANSHKELHISALQAPPTATISYLGTATVTANASSFTFSSHTLGVADSNRRIVVTVAGTGGTTATTTGCSIAGVTATEAIEAVIDGEYITSIWYADVASGTSGDIVVTWSGSKGNTGIGVYRVINGGTLVDTGRSSNQGSAQSATLTCTAGNVIVANTIYDASRSATWSATVTEQFDAQLESTGYYAGAMGTANAGDVTVTATSSGSTTYDSMTCAAFGPS